MAHRLFITIPYVEELRSIKADRNRHGSTHGV
jgi:hypothetical protein